MDQQIKNDFSIIINDIKGLIHDLNHTIHHKSTSFIEPAIINETEKSEGINVVYLIIWLLVMIIYLNKNKSQKEYSGTFQKGFYKLMMPIVLFPFIYSVQLIMFVINFIYFLCGSIQFRKIGRTCYLVEKCDEGGLNVKVWEYEEEYRPINNE